MTSERALRHLPKSASPCSTAVDRDCGQFLHVTNEVATAQVLAGTKVLDMSRFIAGPLCAQMLGDMGAEVIKLERPSGEDARHHAPFINGESLYIMMYNRNKLGATLDSRSGEAPAILEKLFRWADVLVETHRPGTLAQMGFSYE